jgi:hypothetical protein
MVPFGNKSNLLGAQFGHEARQPVADFGFEEQQEDLICFQRVPYCIALLFRFL